MVPIFFHPLQAFMVLIAAVNTLFLPEEQRARHTAHRHTPSLRVWNLHAPKPRPAAALVGLTVVVGWDALVFFLGGV